MTVKCYPRLEVERAQNFQTRSKPGIIGHRAYFEPCPSFITTLQIKVKRTN